MKRETVFSPLFVLAFGFFTVALRSEADGVKKSEFKPSLSIGEEWRVEVKKMTEAPCLPENEMAGWKAREQKVIYLCVAEASRDIDAEKCYCIRIETEEVDGKTLQGPGKYWRIYLRQRDFTLKMVVRLNSGTDHVEASGLFHPGPIDATDWVGILPLAFPSFHEETAEQESTRNSRRGDVEFKASERCRQTEEVIRIRNDEKEKDALKITLEKKRDGNLSCRTTEIWEREMPWWTEATHERDGKQWCSARLLKP